jgi:hypothetical protein
MNIQDLSQHQQQNFETEKDRNSFLSASQKIKPFIFFIIYSHVIPWKSWKKDTFFSILLNA